MRISTLVFFCMAFANVGIMAGASLGPGVVYQVMFSTDPLAAPCPGPCNTLFFELQSTGGGTIGNPVATVQLFDGNTLLGSFTSPGACCAFIAAGSPFGLGAPVVDFTTILNGSINGIVDVSVTGGSFTWNNTAVALGTSFNQGGLSDNAGSLTVLSTTFITPEPSSLYLLAVGSLIIASIRARHDGARERRDNPE